MSYFECVTSITALSMIGFHGMGYTGRLAVASRVKQISLQVESRISKYVFRSVRGEFT